MSFLSAVFPSDNTRNLKKLRRIADKVVALEEEFKQKTDDELREKTIELRDRIANGEKPMDVLPEAFANVIEASGRVLGMRHFYVQVMGGIALFQGRIAEMKTGEGKTLVSTLPAYLGALVGNGVHVVTVNEYLAERDAEWMGKIHKFLGLTVGVIKNNMTPDQKQKAYACDITYGTNNEIGFDYLRDNMATRKQDRMQRGFAFAIVDEVDSILIDEARTPLIISGRGTKSSDVYYAAQKFGKSLKPDEDFEIDLKTKAIILTESGVAKAERFFGVENLTDIEHIELNHHINNALKANFVMLRDENYIVKDGEILIVDEFTGRIMQGRRYSEGLHQAIEAKEGVEVKPENRTLATITFQNLFRMYKKLSGMTGTAKTEESEFNGIYKLDVVQIPPNRPNARHDAADIIYTTRKGKIKAIINEIQEKHATGQPCLVGTITIEQSEELSNALKKAGIEHVVLNAKNHELESEIVAQAGRKGAVTIATNMAGRGTDILLGGNPEYLAKKEMRKKEFSEEQISFATSFFHSDDEELMKARAAYQVYYEEFKKTTDAEKLDVVASGGLHIIGTERHESRRIDNQLRGRAGRQGDPGSSVFFISLEDDLAKRFGGEIMQRLAFRFNIDEDTPFQLKMLSRQVEKAQKRIELQHFSARRNVLEYDDVMNRQREIIYTERNKVLDGEDVHAQIMEMYPDIVGKLVTEAVGADKPFFEWNLEAMNHALETKLFPKGTNLVTEDFVEEIDQLQLIDKIVEQIQVRYDSKVLAAKEIGLNFSDLERHFLLVVVDTLWTQHIDQMSMLKQEIGLQSYGQRNPVIEYKRVGFRMFEEMIEKIREDTATYLFARNIEVRVQQPALPKNPLANIKLSTNKTETSKGMKADAHIGRNEKCPCGSGKKYKQCCGNK